MQLRYEHWLYLVSGLYVNSNFRKRQNLHCASVAKEDSSQYMYDCDKGPVVCTKKYGRNERAYSPSSQSILPGLLLLNPVCMTIDQMYTPKFRMTTKQSPTCALRR